MLHQFDNMLKNMFFCFPLKAVLWGMFVKFALPISKLVMLIYIKTMLLESKNT